MFSLSRQARELQKIIQKRRTDKSDEKDKEMTLRLLKVEEGIKQLMEPTPKKKKFDASKIRRPIVKHLRKFFEKINHIYFEKHKIKFEEKNKRILYEQRKAFSFAAFEDRFSEIR